MNGYCRRKFFRHHGDNRCDRTRPGSGTRQEPKPAENGQQEGAIHLINGILYRTLIY